MTQINLRDLFPEYTLDCFVEVPNENVEAFKNYITREVADVFVIQQRRENAYERRLYRNNAQYSLDYGNEIENEAADTMADPLEVLLDKLDMQQLCIAMASLPKKQSERIHANYILGLSMREIARREGVSKTAVSESINTGFITLKNILKNF